MTATLNQLLAPYSPLVRKLVRQTRALIKEQLPEAVESVDSENVGLGIAEGYKGLIFVISPQKDYVNLGIYDGATLPDPSHLLQGAGKRHRHTKLRKLSDLTSLPLNELIQQAIRRKLGG